MILSVVIFEGLKWPKVERVILGGDRVVEVVLDNE